ncbi:hypothetical protein C8R44DRAFT_737187 [Mycena epipterygia]|nr:hypothetical protein C8R44DRAFT_737187 [Mycena epipterygia]
MEPNDDLCEELALKDEEVQQNEKALQTDQVLVFDPNYSLLNMSNGFRIFAFEDSLKGIPARRYKFPGPQPPLMTVYLHVNILHPGEFEPSVDLMIKTFTNGRQENKTPKNVPLLVCSSSHILAQTLVKERAKYENDFLDPKFRLLKAVLALLNERVFRIQLRVLM